MPVLYLTIDTGKMKAEVSKVASEVQKVSDELDKVSLFHEIIHNRQNNVKSTDYQSMFCELITQWSARRMYPDFMKSIGGQAKHQQDIIEKGYGYRFTVKNFETLRKAIGVTDDKEMLNCFLDIMKNNPNNSYEKPFKKFLTDTMAKNLGKKQRIDKAALNKVIGKLGDLHPNDFSVLIGGYNFIKEK